MQKIKSSGHYLHRSMVQFLCSCVHCWCFWWWTVVRRAHDQSAHMQSHTQQTMMHLYLSEPTWTFLAVWAMLTHLWNRLIQASLCSLHASVSWATCDPVVGSSLFLPWTTFDGYWSVQKWSDPVAITIWPLSNSLKSWYLPIVPASNTSTLRRKCSLTP